MNTLRASLKRYFLTGLLVITPIWGTILILKTLFVTVDSILGTALADLVLPDYYFPGLGIMALVLLILLAGVLAYQDGWLDFFPESQIFPSGISKKQ